MKTEVSISERLKDLRVEKKLNLEELAELTGISKSALGSYELDTPREMNHKNLIALADFYEVSVDYLLGRTENRTLPNAPLSELRLSDATVELLKSGSINNRLLCELVTHEKFAELLAEERVPDTAAHTTKEIITKALSQEELDMLQYYMTSGVYGTFDRRIENNVKKYSKNGGSSKLRYVIKRIFPGMETYQDYPFFYKHKWLLPVCWLYRLLRVVFQRERRERILREADAVRKVKV